MTKYDEVRRRYDKRFLTEIVMMSPSVVRPWPVSVLGAEHLPTSQLRKLKTSHTVSEAEHRPNKTDLGAKHLPPIKVEGTEHLPTTPSWELNTAQNNFQYLSPGN